MSNPEFLAEGTAINDLINPARILIGGNHAKSIKSLSNIYSNWIDKDKIITTNLWSSELSKLIAKRVLSSKSKLNKFCICYLESTGANIQDVALQVGKDYSDWECFKCRSSFGGSCFKKDILNLVYICNHYGLHEVSQYWEQIININDWQKKRISKLIVQNFLEQSLEKK